MTTDPRELGLDTTVPASVDESVPPRDTANRPAQERLLATSAAAAALDALATCDFAGGNPADGFARLERAVALCEDGRCWSGHLDAFRHALGLKLFQTGRDRKRGVAMIRAARAGFTDSGREADVKEVDAWLKEHAPR